MSLPRTMIDSIRLRLALSHLLILACLQVGLCLGVYLFLFDHLIRQADRVLQTVIQSVNSDLHQSGTWTAGGPITSYTATLALNALIHNETPAVILDSSGNMLAERPSRASSITPL